MKESEYRYGERRPVEDIVSSNIGFQGFIEALSGFDALMLLQSSNGNTPTEIAEKMQVSRSTVYQRLADMQCSLEVACG